MLSLSLRCKIAVMNTLYPMKFAPLFRDKIWGGSKIRELLGYDVGALPNCGEAWLISGVDGEPTLISNGYLAGNELNELVEVFMGDLVGDAVYERFGDQFPILFKILDSNDWLSVQVHPNDQLAAARGTGFGKTECWYVLQADEHASLIAGFNTEMDRDRYEKAFVNGQLKDILNVEQVKAGDVFYMPAGRVHALGPGCLIAEIQQTSDTTYRIYDWDRVDSQGKSRQLHTNEALDAIDFNKPESYRTNYQAVTNQAAKLIDSPFFSINLITLDKVLIKDYSNLDSFVILFAAEGSFSVHWQEETVETGKAETILLPAALGEVEIRPEGNAVILEVFIRPN
jgi:mannose-6-phosphate isomerase